MVRAHIGSSGGKRLFFDLDNLTRHVAVVGTTGSGKTVMCKVLVEEALMNGIPVIAIDPKGDIGSMGILRKNMDFRPFGGLTKKTAITKAEEYKDNFKKTNVKWRKGIDRLSKIKTQIYTPKCSAGKQVSFMPKLEAPEKFKLLTELDPIITANFVEPVSENILSLANIKGQLKEKAQSLISSILIHNWEQKKDLSLKELIQQVVNPPIDLVGTLPLDDYIQEKDRKKIAASINLLLTSPSIKSWDYGEPLKIADMLKKNTLTVFDLRFSGNIAEKQFVAERLMQEIYKYLLHQGGSKKLKFILYFDELAGFLPPAPANPSSKRLLELLVRQARAFGMGMLLATQNPGDVDYKILGNVGTRFIGKLRTVNDIKKISSATNMSANDIKVTLAGITTGEFIYNNAVENITKVMKARWIHSFHQGSLQLNEIRWVNDFSLIPKIEDKPDFTNIQNSKKAEKKKKVNVHDDSKDILKELIEKVKNEANITKIQMAVTSETLFAPHLKIVIEPRKNKGLDLEMQGPYVFDLTTKIIPLENYLRKVHWSQKIKKDIRILRPHRSIKQTFDYTIRGAQNNLRIEYYESTLINMKRTERLKIEKMNFEYLMQDVKRNIDKINAKYGLKNRELLKRMETNNSKIRDLNSRNLKQKTSRLVKNILTKKKLIAKTKEMREWEKKIARLQRENKHLKSKIDKNNKISKNLTEKLTERTRKKASSMIKKSVHRPSRDKLIIHATILLVPVKRI